MPFTFHLTNQGTGNLRIKRVRSTCSCSVVDKPTGSIAPGGAAKITVSYRPAQARGAFVHRVFVETDDPAFPVVPLTISGTSTHRLRIEPLSLEFGPVVQGQTASSHVFLKYTGDESFQVLRAVPEGEGAGTRGLRTEVESMDQGGGTGADRPQSIGYVVRAELDTSGCAKGPARGRIAVHTNLRKRPVILLPFTVEVLSPVVASPSTVFFGEVRTGKRTRTVVKISHRAGKSVRVLSVRSQLAGLSSVFPADPRSHAEVQSEVGNG